MSLDSVGKQQKYFRSGYKNFNVQSFREMMDSMCGDEITRSVPIFRDFVPDDDLIAHVLGFESALLRDIQSEIRITEEVQTVQNQCILDNDHWGRHDCGTFKWHHGFKSFFKFSFKLRVWLLDL